MLIQNQIPDIKKEIKKKDLLDLIESEYSTLGPQWLNSQMEWLNNIYTSFNDHDKFLIVIYLFKKTLDFYSRNFIKLTYKDCYENDTVEIADFNVAEVAKALNIPKESARRKIKELEGMGVIKRYKKKIVIDRSCFVFIKPVKTIIRIARFLSVLSKLCVDSKILPKNLPSEKIELVINKNFSYIWKIYYEMQMSMMISYKKIFKDLETFHIFGTCAVNQHLHSQIINKETMNRDKFFNSLSSKKIQGINAMSISDITGIPRATVIRKLQRLVKMNNLTINDKKLYKVSGIFSNEIKARQKIVLGNLADFSAKTFNVAAHY